MRAKTKKWMLYPTPRDAPLPRRHPLIPAAMVWMGASERSSELFPMAYRIPMLTRGVEA